MIYRSNSFVVYFVAFFGLRAAVLVVVPLPVLTVLRVGFFAATGFGFTADFEVDFALVFAADLTDDLAAAFVVVFLPAAPVDFTAPLRAVLGAAFAGVFFAEADGVLATGLAAVFVTVLAASAVVDFTTRFAGAFSAAFTTVLDAMGGF